MSETSSSKFRPPDTSLLVPNLSVLAQSVSSALRAGTPDPRTPIQFLELKLGRGSEQRTISGSSVLSDLSTTVTAVFEHHRHLRGDGLAGALADTLEALGALAAACDVLRTTPPQIIGARLSARGTSAAVFYDTVARAARVLAAATRPAGACSCPLCRPVHRRTKAFMAGAAAATVLLECVVDSPLAQTPHGQGTFCALAAIVAALPPSDPPTRNTLAGALGGFIGRTSDVELAPETLVHLTLLSKTLTLATTPMTTLRNALQSAASARMVAHDTSAPALALATTAVSAGVNVDEVFTVAPAVLIDARSGADQHFAWHLTAAVVAQETAARKIDDTLVTRVLTIDERFYWPRCVEPVAATLECVCRGLGRGNGHRSWLPALVAKVAVAVAKISNDRWCGERTVYSTIRNALLAASTAVTTTNATSTALALLQLFVVIPALQSEEVQALAEPAAAAAAATAAALAAAAGTARTEADSFSASARAVVGALMLQREGPPPAVFAPDAALTAPPHFLGICIYHMFRAGIFARTTVRAKTTADTTPAAAILRRAAGDTPAGQRGVAAVAAEVARRSGLDISLNRLFPTIFSPAELVSAVARQQRVRQDRGHAQQVLEQSGVVAVPSPFIKTSTTTDAKMSTLATDTTLGATTTIPDTPESTPPPPAPAQPRPLPVPPLTAPSPKLYTSSMEMHPSPTLTSTQARTSPSVPLGSPRGRRGAGVQLVALAAELCTACVRRGRPKRLVGLLDQIGDVSVDCDAESRIGVFLSDDFTRSASTLLDWASMASTNDEEQDNNNDYTELPADTAILSVSTRFLEVAAGLVADQLMAVIWRVQPHPLPRLACHVLRSLPREPTPLPADELTRVLNAAAPYIAVPSLFAGLASPSAYQTGAVIEAVSASMHALAAVGAACERLAAWELTLMPCVALFAWIVGSGYAPLKNESLLVSVSANHSVPELPVWTNYQTSTVTLEGTLNMFAQQYPESVPRVATTLIAAISPLWEAPVITSARGRTGAGRIRITAMPSSALRDACARALLCLQPAAWVEASVAPHRRRLDASAVRADGHPCFDDYVATMHKLLCTVAGTQVSCQAPSLMALQMMVLESARALGLYDRSEAGVSACVRALATVAPLQVLAPHPVCGAAMGLWAAAAESLATEVEDLVADREPTGELKQAVVLLVTELGGQMRLGAAAAAAGVKADCTAALGGAWPAGYGRAVTTPAVATGFLAALRMQRAITNITGALINDHVVAAICTPAPLPASQDRAVILAGAALATVTPTAAASATQTAQTAAAHDLLASVAILILWSPATQVFTKVAGALLGLSVDAVLRSLGFAAASHALTSSRRNSLHVAVRRPTMPGIGMGFMSPTLASAANDTDIRSELYRRILEPFTTTLPPLPLTLLPPPIPPQRAVAAHKIALMTSVAGTEIGSTQPLLAITLALRALGGSLRHFSPQLAPLPTTLFRTVAETLDANRNTMSASGVHDHLWREAGRLVAAAAEARGREKVANSGSRAVATRLPTGFSISEGLESIEYYLFCRELLTTCPNFSLDTALITTAGSVAFGDLMRSVLVSFSVDCDRIVRAGGRLDTELDDPASRPAVLLALLSVLHTRFATDRPLLTDDMFILPFWNDVLVDSTSVSSSGSTPQRLLSSMPSPEELDRAIEQAKQNGHQQTTAPVLKRPSEADERLGHSIASLVPLHGTIYAPAVLSSAIAASQGTRDVSQPPLSFSSLLPLAVTLLRRMPQLVPLTTRRVLLMDVLAPAPPAKQLSLARARLLPEFCTQVMQMGAEERRAQWKVVLVGEAGVDLRGVRNDVYVRAANELIAIGLFKSSGASGDLWPSQAIDGLNPTSQVTDPAATALAAALSSAGFTAPSPHTTAMLLCTLAGVLVGRALVEGMTVPLTLSPVIWKRVLGLPMSYHDVALIDPSVYQNLILFVRDTEDIDSVMPGATFTFALADSSAEVELCPDGANRILTDANRGDYVRLVAQYLLNTRSRDAIDALTRGFTSTVSADWASLFCHNELAQITSGQDISVDDLSANIRFITDSPAQKSDFCSVLRSWSAADVRALVTFVCGSGVAPLGGFKVLDPPFTVQVTDNASLLPTASTCFNLLKLSPWTTSEELSSKLLLSVRACADSGGAFGLQ